METNQIICGDSLQELQDLDENSVHAVVTDPPYGLAFMGRSWDDFEPREYQEWCEKWAKRAKRVLKPGGHLLAFSGNRTHHRLFTGFEDAGFEIRDTLTWHYGSGFPKAGDISKTIDKRADAEREVVGYEEPFGRENRNSGRGVREEYVGGEDDPHGSKKLVKPPATDAAKKWDGWKTGLKPATEFVVMARKPFDGATVDCVQEHGTGALNIDGTRIGTEERENQSQGTANGVDYGTKVYEGETVEGRYPANVVFDETEAERLDREVGELAGGTQGHEATSIYRNDMDTENQGTHKTDSGGPSRYFYTSKASKAERTEDGSIENSHPTVKPLDLMEWLVKLVTREGQIILDPFCGSGTTCKAVKSLNREFIGIEKQSKWADVARVRCNLTPNNPNVVRKNDNQEGLEQYTE